jgi:beta-mannosidase
MTQLCLDGPWKIRRVEAPPGAGALCALQARGWHEFRVPGQWQQHPDFADAPEAVLFARHFDAPDLAGRPARIELHEVFYHAVVWINRRRVGEQRGWIFPHRHAVPAGLLKATGNTIHVQVHCRHEDDPFEKRQILGVFGHWDGALPGAFAGGIAGSVTLAALPEAELEAIDLCPTWHDGAGRIDVEAVITNRTDAADLHLDLEATCRLRGRPVGPTLRAGGTHHVPAGRSRHTFRLDVPAARRWWPWDCGEPYLYDCRLRLRAADRVLFGARRNCAFRRFEFRNWKYRVNGRRVFLRGTSLTPPQFYLSQVDPARYVEDIDHCRELNCNLVRVHGFVASKACYDRADEIGLLVWQDFPMHWHFARSVLGEAVRQTGLLVRRLRHHPSLAFWNCQNEPFLHTEPRITKGDRLQEAKLIGSVVLDNWNKRVLAPAMHAVVRRLAPDLPSMPFSGCYGIFATGTDSHFYFGTYYGRFRWMRWFRNLGWRGLRLVSEYGCFAFPTIEHLPALLELWERIPEHREMPFGLAPWAWSRFLEVAGLGRTSMIVAERTDELATAGRLPEVAAASHAYQAELLKYYTEFLRLIRYEPASAAISYQLRDSCLMAGLGLIDHLGGRRPAFEAYRQSNAPAVVIVDYPKPRYRPGERLRLGVYAINDHPWPLADCEIRVTVLLRGKPLAERRYRRTLPPDSLTPLGPLQCRLPTDPPQAEATLTTHLSHDGKTIATNTYPLHIGRRGPA